MRNLESKIEKLSAICGHKITIEINGHLNFDGDIESFLHDDMTIVNDDVLQKMIEKNTMICVTAYTSKGELPITVYHHDINKALNYVIFLASNRESVKSKWSVADFFEKSQIDGLNGAVILNKKKQEELLMLIKKFYKPL